MPTSLSPVAIQQFLDNDGTPAAGFKLYTYAAGTVNPQATYQDRAGTVPNANPIILNARGEAVIYITPGVVYDYVLRTPSDALVWTREDVTADGGDATTVTFLQAGSGAVARPSQDKMRESVSVLDFGADPTGALDSSVPFQNASDAVGADGLVIVPEGSYRLETTNIGSTTTSWDKRGTVTFSGAGSILSPDGDGIRRFHNWTRFGNGINTQQFVDFNDPNDANRAHFYSFIVRSPTNDRAGNMYLQFENTADSTACVAQMIQAWHRGENTTGFPGAQTMYSTAAKLNGASVLSSFISVLSPAHDVPGSEWNSGLCYAQEINFGNRWAEFGLQKDPTLSRWVGGQIIAPDVLQGPDGGGTGYAFHAQYGTLYGNATNGGPDRRIWIPICIKQDTMPPGGIGIHPRGSTSGTPGQRPLAIMEAALNWDWGIDLGKAEIGNAYFRGRNMHITGGGDITHGILYNNAGGEVAVEVNSNSEIGGGVRNLVFRKEGRFGMPNAIVPTSASAAGNAGDIAWDSNYFYVCVASNSWKRVAIAAW